MQYYNEGNAEAFVKLLESSLIYGSYVYKNCDKDHMRALDTLAAYYVQTGYREKNTIKSQEYFNKASRLYTTADKIIMYDKVNLILFFVMF